MQVPTHCSQGAGLYLTLTRAGCSAPGWPHPGKAAATVPGNEIPDSLWTENVDGAWTGQWMGRPGSLVQEQGVAAAAQLTTAEQGALAALWPSLGPEVEAGPPSAFASPWLG